MSETPLNDAVVVHETSMYRLVIDQYQPEDVDGPCQITSVEHTRANDALGKPIWTDTEDTLVMRMAEDLVDALGVRPEWDDGER